MEITEIRVFLKEGQDKKLKAYATLTFDKAFVVRNVKVIEGNKGLFVAMPSRRLKESCPKCNFKNAMRSKFCNQCGGSLPMAEPRMALPTEEAIAKQSEHKDIAHPITTECRDYIQKKVLEAYEKEKKSPSASIGQYKPASAPQSSAPQAAPPMKPAEVEEDNDIEL